MAAVERRCPGPGILELQWRGMIDIESGESSKLHQAILVSSALLWHQNVISGRMFPGKCECSIHGLIWFYALQWREDVGCT